MTNQHPIGAPPDKLVDAWGDKYVGHMPEWVLRHVAAEAAQWGSDQELQACCDHIRNYQWGFVDRPDGTKMHRAVDLEFARRPQLLSLKGQALAVLDDYSDLFDGAHQNIIRRALEELSND